MNQSTNPTHSDSRKLHLSSLRAAAGVILSRVSGLVRTQIVNAVFGAGIALDAFNVAQRLPSSLRDLFAEGALSAAFTKGIVDAKQNGIEAERALVAIVTGFFGVVTTALAVLGYIFSQPIIKSITEDSFSNGASGQLAVELFKLLVFYLPIAMISAVSMAILSTRQMTFRATLASSFFNVGSIIGALFIAPIFKYFEKDPILGLALGTLLGGIGQWLYQTIPLIKMGLFPVPNFNLKAWRQSAKLLEIVKLMLPRVGGQGATTLALMVNTYFTTQIGIGAVTYVTNAQTLILMPIGLFGVATGFSSLPMLSSAVVSKDELRFSELLYAALWPTAVLAIGTVLGLCLMALPTCVILFEHGKFLRHDSIQTAIALCAYAPAIFFNSMGKIVVQSFYALGDTKIILWKSFVYLAINAALSAYLSPKYGLIGLGFSNSFAAFLDLLISIIMLEKIGKGIGFKNIFKVTKNKLKFPYFLILSTTAFLFAASFAGKYYVQYLSTMDRFF